ncbi:MAG: ADP-forming succinate--CoA ligase subunit beta [Alphaproteobacteria bacterium]|nr:ADP-forming succinate--CoA ligase subunit beta [Alphaproteobacteria bacterium]
MNLHEYQAKELLAKFGVPVPRGKVAVTAEEARTAARELGSAVCVVKAQVHAGGRGKGGGIKVVRSPDEAAEAARGMLGRKLITHQTGPGGRPIDRVWVEEGSTPARELYLALLVDRARGWPAFIASTEGGMDIEAVAAKTPDKIITIGVDPATGWQAFHGRRLAVALKLSGEQAKAIGGFGRSLYRAFLESDASLVEINPLVVTTGGQLIALDAKINLDDNATFRHTDLAAMRDTAQEDQAEVEATQAGLNFIKLDGSIGCLVNGAGLAMATMDIIKLAGGDPANFLDVGGGATKEQVAKAFRIILTDPKVEGILVNIFGGIMRCDVIAEGVVAAARELGLKVPLVVRLAGTNVDLGKRILATSGLAITPADDLDDAARKIVAAIGKAA